MPKSLRLQMLHNLHVTHSSDTFGQQVQCDLAEYGGQDYMLIADEISGFLKVTRTKNKSTKEAIRCLRQWGATFGLPYRAKTDNGPSYRDEFRAECKALGIEVIHSSCYNAPSQGLIERKVGLFKELLKKARSSLTQLQIDELIYEVNALEELNKDSVNLISLSCLLLCYRAHLQITALIPINTKTDPATHLTEKIISVAHVNMSQISF